MANTDTAITDYLSGVVGVVEATDNERHMLWDANQRYRKMTWEQARHGYGPVVGRLDDMPIAISILTANVDGHKLLFVHPTSVVVDHRQIDKWLTETLPQSAFREDGYINRVDAGNFINVFPHPPRPGAQVISELRTVEDIRASAEAYFRSACAGMGNSVTEDQVANAVKKLTKHIMAVRPDIKRVKASGR
jgi:hypothetical protein